MKTIKYPTDSTKGMKLLFVCTHNIMRSCTGETLYNKKPGFNARSAGTANFAKVKLSDALIAWADVIFVMEEKHRQFLVEGFKQPLGDTTVVVLNIPDNYDYMEPELVRVLEEKVGRWLSARGN